jgi:phage portal protein BeeE
MSLDAALNRAYSQAERLRDAARKAADTRPSGIVAGGPSASLGRANLGAHAEQYAHFRGWQYVAIRAIAQRIAGQPIRVARVAATPKGRKSADEKALLPLRLKSCCDRLEPLESHPLLDALADPNPLMVAWSLVFTTVAILELTGKAHWWLSPQNDRLSIWPVPSHWIEPVDDMRTVWNIRPPKAVEPTPVPGDQIAYFSLPDPGNPLGTVSPLSTQAAAVNADESIQEAQYRAFQNGINPGVVLTAGRLPDMANGRPGARPVLEPEQRTQLINAIRQAYQGAHRHGEPIILDGLIEDVKPFTRTPQEMAFLDSGKSTKCRIFQAFGVNPLIVGEIEGANRAQAVVAEDSFCTNAVNPLMELMSQVMTAWLSLAFRSEKLVVWVEPCRANDPEQTLKEWELGLKFGAVTQNEYRSHVLNLPEVTGLDLPLLPVGMVPRD